MMGEQYSRPSFADVAVALRTADIDLAEMSFCLWLQSAASAERAAKLDQLAARIGLAPDVTQRIIQGERRHAEVIAFAHDFFRAAIAHEDEFLELLARTKQEREHDLWRRLQRKVTDFVKGRGRRT
jgi:hypothetical protein